MNKLRKIDFHPRDAEHAEFGGLFNLKRLTLRPPRLGGEYFEVKQQRTEKEQNKGMFTAETPSTRSSEDFNLKRLTLRPPCLGGEYFEVKQQRTEKEQNKDMFTAETPSTRSSGDFNPKRLTLRPPRLGGELFEVKQQRTEKEQNKDMFTAETLSTRSPENFHPKLLTLRPPRLGGEYFEVKQQRTEKEQNKGMFTAETPSTRSSEDFNLKRLTLRPPRLGGEFSLGMVAVFVALAVAGCAVGPDYRSPEIAAPETWTAGLRRGLTAEEPEAQTLAEWWNTFGDADLTFLIERAVSGNVDVQRAAARVREARARRGIAQADLYPWFDLGASATVRRGSEETGSGSRRELYRAGFDASWEIDVFGGVRRSIEAAQGDLEASVADYRDVLVSLVAEVALNYVEMRTLQTRLQVAEENLKAQAETLQLVEWRFAAGLVSSLDVEQARSNLENTRAQLPALRSNIEAAKNRLAILLGAFPGMLQAQLAARKPIPEAPLEVAVGVPAEALRRRPDVRRAERQLAAQTARIGVATADLYPRFALPGSIGLESLSTNHLFSGSSLAWSVIGQFAWPVFRGGAIRQNIEVQNALQEQTLKQYEATILIALEDVENALTAFAEEQERSDALTELTLSARRAADLARDQYASGLIDFQSVLDSERTLLTAQDQVAQSKGQVGANLISLYKALGGGWTPMVGIPP